MQIIPTENIKSEFVAFQIGMFNCPIHGAEVDAYVLASIYGRERPDEWEFMEGQGQRALSEMKYSVKWVPFWVK